jgi:hypothetical protein
LKNVQVEGGAEARRRTTGTSKPEKISRQLIFENPARPFSFSATSFTEEELASKLHHHELLESNATVVYLNSFMMGLGNSSCGPGVLQQFTLMHSIPSLEFSVRWTNN